MTRAGTGSSWIVIKFQIDFVFEPGSDKKIDLKLCLNSFQIKNVKFKFIPTRPY